MSETLCKSFHELRRSNIALAGGKGANLSEMVHAGLPVPPGFVVGAPAYCMMMSIDDLDRQITDMLLAIDCCDSYDVRQVELPIREMIENVPMPEAIRAEIVDQYRALGDNVPVAVRSSATAEDLADASFAGQQDTLLNVIGEEKLLLAVKKCWSSLYNSNAIYYRAQRGFAGVQVSMAVVVQKMICSEKSGVTFTVDPVTRNPYVMLIEGVYGLGEGIVSGAITPDHYKVDRETYEILYRFRAPKSIMIQSCGDQGVETVTIPPDVACNPVLTDDEVTRLVQVGNTVEDYFGSPQDIEWGIEAENIYILQSRPITSL
jgi:phosphoenolpyruvate synthase/pyruvate phosphate dikinase